MPFKIHLAMVNTVLLHLWCANTFTNKKEHSIVTVTWVTHRLAKQGFGKAVVVCWLLKRLRDGSDHSTVPDLDRSYRSNFSQIKL